MMWGCESTIRCLKLRGPSDVSVYWVLNSTRCPSNVTQEFPSNCEWSVLCFSSFMRHEGEIMTLAQWPHKGTSFSYICGPKSTFTKGRFLILELLFFVMWVWIPSSEELAKLTFVYSNHDNGIYEPYRLSGERIPMLSEALKYFTARIGYLNFRQQTTWQLCYFIRTTSTIVSCSKVSLAS